METKKIALFLYIISSLLAIFAIVQKNEALILLTKPAIVPAVYFYYLALNKNNQVNLCFTFILFLNFVGDTFVLLDFKNPVLFVMIPYFLFYLLLLRFAIIDLRKFVFDKIGLLFAVIFFICMFIITYVIIDIFMIENQKLVIPVIIFAIFLATYGSISVYCYYCKRNLVFYYLWIFVMVSILSDVFYIVYHLVYPFPYFNYFEISMQFLSYFLMVKYFISMSESKLISTLEQNEI